jgi:superfamily I DNA and RNA helicase
MSSSFFFLQAEKNADNKDLISEIEDWANENRTQAYVIDRPLGDERYDYSHDGSLIVLIPGRKISLIDFSGDSDGFNDFIEDFIEDLGSISDKFRYKDAIGRPRKWRDQLISTHENGPTLPFSQILEDSNLADPSRRRVAELIVSLLTGSINDIEKVKADLPENLLDKVKRKILLFDGDQTRFIYQKIDKKVVNIQGLSGTGKTELLLHKLKDIYVNNPSSRVVFTCHNKILADNLKRRIPEFFNFMKVEQQIAWNERLWCMHAWGSQSDRNSGTYRYICYHYGLTFRRFSYDSPFDVVCRDAISQLQAREERSYAFDYILIDESQDFPPSFIELCQMCAREIVYVAGDIFQSIFDESIIPSISPDFLLSKCYRTDPKTLMFAHALGMGLFEPRKLRWLDDAEWRTCGYIVDKSSDLGFYRLKREPLRRFEDIESANLDCVSILQSNDISTTIIETIDAIALANPTIEPDDIGIILLDTSRETYALADRLEQTVPRHTGWSVNKAYESKSKMKGHIFISNKNNVKGLEFPFVICVTDRIRNSYSYRNSLYMTLTRSFLKSYLILSHNQDDAVLGQITSGLQIINNFGYIEAKPPTENEKIAIRTTIQQSSSPGSYFDFIESIFDKIGILPLFRDKLRTSVTTTLGEEYDPDVVERVARFNYDAMLKSGRDEEI